LFRLFYIISAYAQTCA